MKTLALTGGIGMGKSTAAELLRQRGLPVIDTDQIARDVVEPGQPALAEVALAFGSDVLDDTGCLRRDELARRVFADAAARHRLESILHPRIREIWQNQIKTWKAEGHAAAVVVIPLLYETGIANQFGTVLCAGCTPVTQRTRLAARGWSEEEIEQRCRAQMSAEKKMALADFVIWTEGAMEVHAEQVELILQFI